MLSLAETTASKLRDEIRTGNYMVGQRLSDEHSLADRLGVSRGTIRQALNILSHERLIVRQQGRGTFVSNPTYGQIGGTKTSLLGILVYNKEYFSMMLEGASTRAASCGYMLVTGSNMSVDEETTHVDSFINNEICGVIMSPRPDDRCENYDKLIQSDIPVVMLDTIIADRHEDFAGQDDYEGSIMATKYLLSLGHKKLAYFGHNNPRDVPCRYNRRRGFLDTCERSNISGRFAQVVEQDERDYHEPLRQLLCAEDRPTAILAFNDFWAIKAIEAARQLGLSVPKDISVIGIDDTEFGRSYDIPLTTIHPEFEKIGRLAVDMLLDKIQNPGADTKYSILIRPKLIIRQSTSEPR